MRRLLLALLIQLAALAAFAQASGEFGRASGGMLETIAKTPRHTSASFTLLSGHGYEGTLGGQLVADRLWFFGSGSLLPRTSLSNVNMTNVNAKATAQPVDWTNVTASFSDFRQPLFSTTLTPNSGSLSQSFLSLRSTAVLSDRMILDLSVSRSNSAHSVNP
jgi:hypothetical protein